MKHAIPKYISRVRKILCRNISRICKNKSVNFSRISSRKLSASWKKKLCAHTIMQSCNNRRNYRCRYSWVNLSVLLTKLFSVYKFFHVSHHNFFPCIFKFDISKRWFFDFQNRCPLPSILEIFRSNKLCDSTNVTNLYITFFLKFSIHLLLWNMANVAVKCNEEFAACIPEFFIRFEACCAKAAILHDNLIGTPLFMCIHYTLFTQLCMNTYFPLWCIVRYKLKALLRASTWGIAFSAATVQRKFAIAATIIYVDLWVLHDKKEEKNAALKELFRENMQ